MFRELWSNRSVISKHFSEKIGTATKKINWRLGEELGWLILVLLVLLLLYTLIRYYDWSRKQPSTTNQSNQTNQSNSPHESAYTESFTESFTPDEWPDRVDAGVGNMIINYIQPGDHQCANLQAYIAADYLIHMNQPNIQARGFDTLAELSDRYRQGVCQQISSAEQLATTKWIADGLSGLKNSGWHRIAEKWLAASYLCKAAPWLEGGMPHTHGRAILMRPDWFQQSSNTSASAEQIGILWHEIMHIWQRFQPEDFTGLYQEWGFSPVSETPVGLETVMLRSRLNPDALPPPNSPIWIWQPNGSSTCYWIGALYPTLTPASLHDIKFRAYPLAAGGTRYLGQQPIELSKLREFAGFFGSGRNHYHPNELAAHYMDELLTGRIDLDVPSTLNYKPTLVGSNSSETPGPSHSKAHPGGWAYNRVSTVPACQIFSKWLAKF